MSHSAFMPPYSLDSSSLQNTITSGWYRIGTESSRRYTMARTSTKPRYYDSKQAWYANIDGERILLVRGPKKATEEVAKEKYADEMAARKVEVAGDRNTVWAVLN